MGFQPIFVVSFQGRIQHGGDRRYGDGDQSEHIIGESVDRIIGGIVQQRNELPVQLQDHVGDEIGKHQRNADDKKTTQHLLFVLKRLRFAECNFPIRKHIPKRDQHENEGSDDDVNLVFQKREDARIVKSVQNGDRDDRQKRFDQID